MIEIFVNKCFDLHFYFLFFHYSFYKNYQRIVSGISQNFSTTPYLVYKPNISSTDPISRLQIQHLVYRSNILTNISLTGPTYKPKFRLQIKHLIYIFNISSTIQHPVCRSNTLSTGWHFKPTSRSQAQHLVHKPNISSTGPKSCIQVQHLIHRPNISSSCPTSRLQTQHLVHKPNILSTGQTSRPHVQLLVYMFTFLSIHLHSVQSLSQTSRVQDQHLVHRPNISSTDPTSCPQAQHLVHIARLYVHLLVYTCIFSPFSKSNILSNTSSIFPTSVSPSSSEGLIRSNEPSG